MILSISSNSNAWLLPAYVVQRASGLLPNEILHSALTGADLHPPQIHGPASHTDQTRSESIPSTSFSPSIVVAAARAVIGDMPTYSIPDGNAEVLVAFFRPPDGADHASIVYRVILATATGLEPEGIATIVSELTGYSDGDSLNAVGGGITQDLTIPASALGLNIVQTYTLAYTLPLVVGDVYAVQFQRRGDLGGDTYTQEIYLLSAIMEFTFEQ